MWHLLVFTIWKQRFYYRTNKLCIYTYIFMCVTGESNIGLIHRCVYMFKSTCRKFEAEGPRALK